MTIPYDSPEYLKLTDQGPFPGRIDPWAEDPHYFHQIHGSMIEAIVGQIRAPLRRMGYLVSREVSLQVIAYRQPDILVSAPQRTEHIPRLDYNIAAAAVLANPGRLLLSDDSGLDALYIRDESGELVTVVEIISPSNKTDIDLMKKYQIERVNKFLKQGVNVVEIDATRSVKRLIKDQFAEEFPYHTTVFVVGDPPRILETAFLEPLQRFALPLRTEAIGVEPQEAYTYAYEYYSIADQIQRNRHYTQDHLPFPSLLTSQQQKSALKFVKDWQDELKRLEAT